MLKNEELQAIKKATILLTIIQTYSLEDNDFYDFTKITTKDIDLSIKALNHIIAKYVVKKKIQSDKSNAWNKANPERHRENNRKSGRKNREKKNEYLREYYRKNKEKIKEKRKEKRSEQNGI